MNRDTPSSDRRTEAAAAYVSTGVYRATMFGRRALYVFVAGLLVLSTACGAGDEPVSTTTAPRGTVVSTLPPEEPGITGEDRSQELLARWEVVNYRLPDDGALTNVVGADPVFIEFKADGTVAYNTGCNSGGTEFTTNGAYYEPESPLDDTPQGQPLTMGPVFEQTERGCDGFLGDQDRDLPEHMGAVSRFVLEGERLLLLDEFSLIEANRSR